MIKALSVLFVSVFIWGCAAAPQFQSPPLELKSGRNVSLVRSEILDQTSGTLMHMNENKDVLYQQNFGGGGAALGILLGPIGVAANMAAIESNTKDDVQLLFGKTQVDPNEVFKDMVQRAGFTVVAKSAVDPGLTPYVLVSKGENEILYFASAILVELGDASPKKWRGRYLYQIDASLPKATVAKGLTDEQRASLRSSLRKGFEELLEIYKKDVDGALATGTDVTFKSEFVSPRFNFDMLGKMLSDDPDRVCIRTPAAVFSLPKKYATVAKKEP